MRVIPAYVANEPVFIIGAGSFLTKLVRSLIDSGFSRIRAIVTDASGHALDELAEISGQTESGLEIGPIL